MTVSGMLRRSPWEFLQGKQIQDTTQQRIEDMPPVLTSDGWRIRPTEVSFSFIGDRMARCALSGPYEDGPLAGGNTYTCVYFDSWEQMPDNVYRALSANFPDQGQPA